MLDSKRKLNIIDKSKLDWKAYKRENKQVSIGRPQPSSSPGRPPIHSSLTLTPLRRPLQPKSKTKTKNSCFPFFSGGGGAQQCVKGGDRYTERQEFLKRAELREYEIERDARLASSTRNRGRL